MADLLFVGQFVASKSGKTGLTVTVDVDRYTLADGSRTALVTAGSATEARRGLYHYRLASADLATYQYVATFITADTSVDQQEIAALGLVVPDALVSSRLAPTTAGRTLDVAATGETTANVTHVKDTALTESVAGRLAAALSTLLDVATPVLTAASANQSGDAYARLGAPVGASVSADIADLPTVAEFEARTLLAADYTVVGDLPSVPTAAQNADAVWDEATAGHATAGSTGAALATAATGGDPWLTEVPSAYETGTAGAILGGLPATLANVGATVTVVSAVSGGDITVYANDTWEFTVTDATLSLSGYETIALVVKRTASQDDSDALLYLRSDTGLQRIDGAAPISAANGTLTKTATSFTGNVAISETAGVTPRSNYAWWLKGFDTTPNPDEGFTLATGKFTITPAGLQAIA